ncbi:MAG TPA: lipid-binding SYLF domain-containing protein [Opitutus sp.]|nr:lipid-binding SYLF domain-containing protein [Opitutus sp.]
MKKFLLPLLSALLAASFVPMAAAAPSRAECVTHVLSCEAILREFQANPEYVVPAAVLQRARALVIVNQFKAGFFFGVKGGYGVVMVKKSDGRWSLPVLLSAGEASFGLQFGAKAVESVLVITDEQTPKLLFNTRFNVGVDAKAVIGPKAAEAESNNQSIVSTPVLVYTKSKGLFAGATIKAGFLSRDDKANFALYDTQYTLPELLYSDWVKPIPEVTPLMDYVQKIAP